MEINGSVGWPNETDQHQRPISSVEKTYMYGEVADVDGAAPPLWLSISAVVLKCFLCALTSHCFFSRLKILGLLTSPAQQSVFDQNQIWDTTGLLPRRHSMTKRIFYHGHNYLLSFRPWR